MALLLEKEWFIEAPWGRISILAWGNCFDPPVLLCHGQVDSAASFRPLIQLLPKNFYYIGMELPGHGKSDPFPPGLPINAHDMVYAISVVVKHFRWKEFIYMSHSIATLFGKIYNLSYPGKMTKVVEFDPSSLAETADPDNFAAWYKRYFTRFYENYDVFNAPKESGPIYTREKAIAKLMARRGFTEKNARDTLDRISEPVGDGLIRFTFDQRSKIMTRPPFSPAHAQFLYTNIPTPTLVLPTEDLISYGVYENTPLLLDEKAYPAGNCRVRVIKGNHDVHFIHPERVAPFVIQFLLHGLDGLDSKSKL